MMAITQPLPQEERRALRKALSIIEEFRSLDAEMPLQTAATFLLIALNEGMAQKELAQRLAMATSTASRNVAALTKTTRLRKPGHDLVDSSDNPMELRSKQLTLTPKGVALRMKLRDMIGG